MDPKKGFMTLNDSFIGQTIKLSRRALLNSSQIFSIHPEIMIFFIIQEVCYETEDLLDYFRR